MTNNFETTFQIHKPIIGMIHLAGENSQNKVERALEELIIYKQEKVDGAIIGSYFKPHKNTQMPVDRGRVKDLMIVIREVRKI